MTGDDAGPIEEAVFRALADPTRRAILDALFVEDGQTLTALSTDHHMTRVGVAKHVAILEDAGLVISRRSGREKHHHLNPIPIRLVHDRWIDKYTEPWAAGLVGLKTRLETTMEKVFEIYIKATPSRVWEAITDPQVQAMFNFGGAMHSDWTEGSSWTMNHPRTDRPLASGDNVVVDPPHRLVQSRITTWSDAAQRQGTTRVTWELEAVGDSCKVTVIHDQLPDDAPAELWGGWSMILSGLKTWLETGERLTTPGSLQYG